MATHRVSLQQLTGAPDTEQRGRRDTAQVARSRLAPGLMLFMVAPVSFALTVFAISWISKVSF